MTTEELEELLNAAAEKPELDFKGECSCDPDSLAKDVMAMSNLRGGGRIVIGVKDKTFVRVGVSAEVAATYDEDQMRDQFSRYADPYVDFSVSKVSDANGLLYVVITVREFSDVPTICKKNGKGLFASTLYYRNRNRRVESAPISNSNDLRDLLTLASGKIKDRLADLGYTPSASIEAVLDKELGGL